MGVVGGRLGVRGRWGFVVALPRGRGSVGRWSVVGGRWSVVGGRWSVVGGRLSVVGGRWLVVGGRLSVVGCRGAVVGGRWSVVGGRWSVVGGRWSVVGGRWLVAGGWWLVGLRGLGLRRGGLVRPVGGRGGPTSSARGWCRRFLKTSRGCGVTRGRGRLRRMQRAIPAFGRRRPTLQFFSSPGRRRLVRSACQGFRVATGGRGEGRGNRLSLRIRASLRRGRLTCGRRDRLRSVRRKRSGGRWRDP